MSRVRALAHIIGPSLARGGEAERFGELAERVESGDCVMFEGEHSVLVMETIPEDPSLNAWIVGGDLREIFSLTPGVEAYARAVGCRFISFSGGRKGWSRAMSPLGYAWDGHEFRKAL